MLRRILGVAALTFTTGILVVACSKESGGGSGAEGGSAEAGSGTPKKLTCRMDRQCWICPDEAAIKKCIINPITSGCTKGNESDCTP